MIRQYFDYYGSVPTLEDRDVEADVAKEFILSLPSDRYRSLASYALRAYYSFKGRPDIVAMLPKYRPMPVDIEIFSDYARLWRAILSLPNPDRAILATSYALALRLGEVPLLRAGDFNPRECGVLVHREKGPGGSTVDYYLPLSPCACQVLSDYLGSRRHGPMFYNSQGSPVDKRAVLRAFHTLRAVLGEGERFHQLRHTRATELAERFENAILLQRFLGHKNINVTMRYIHLAKVRQSAQEEHHFHCDKDIPLESWSWVPLRHI